ncbi:hypothetical protein FE783_26680 [Paenibacillus mesophilus]|uniref:hypothetical protein n=1 Tax=Paenibacillus mesophilus TaxID=2582849 RepID=UPI00110E2418|nr:hypothetical protein [Paenibacillus mesophilus]TMV46278.1 hypothetical protein FE783_26680 [Paenibacillus mesophilus]
MRALAAFLAACCFGVWLVFLWSDTSYGKALILPPDKMLEEADVIFTGKIVKFEHVPPKKGAPEPVLVKRIYIKVDQIMKGELDSDIAVLEEWKGGLAVHQNFPDSKNDKLFVMQRKRPDNTLMSVADTYNVGIIRDDRVAEVLGLSSAGNYVPEYNEYYLANKANAKRPPRSVRNFNSTGYVLAASAIAFLLTSGIVWLKVKR